MSNVARPKGHAGDRRPAWLGPPPCVETLDALEHQAVELGGFTTEAAAALIHLREAWCRADPSNQVAVAMAIAALMTARSLFEDRAVFERILTHGITDRRRDDLIASVLSLADIIALWGTGWAVDRLAEFDALAERSK